MRLGVSVLLLTLGKGGSPIGYFHLKLFELGLKHVNGLLLLLNGLPVQVVL